ncbi:helix-turn-helix domain-containing protein [Allopusillimonas ginsengisoli]|uniref:helix-turn-helix domain-containing protein n=1 Tax=Allopusillimonas ginsengisoli TaxID=453575 RepID=UPI001022590D|nr:helix-turn-helix transcriptional regulator [Allopusillimonas ginsengisoli]TEA78201.1 AraC family transcriptional regulator [Allopusillimonas ginsengisoli]
MSTRTMDDVSWPDAGQDTDDYPARRLIGYGGADPRHMDDGSLARLAKTMIGRHVAKFSSVDDLAATLVVDAAKLERAFMAIYGARINTWILQEKFRWAQRLLVETSLGLPDIAARVGYTHPARFVTAFREHVGISPWSFRQLSYGEQIAAIENLNI